MRIMLKRYTKIYIKENKNKAETKHKYRKQNKGKHANNHTKYRNKTKLKQNKEVFKKKYDITKIDLPFLCITNQES